MKTSEKSLSNNLKKLYTNANKAKEKVKKSNSFTSFVGTIKTTSREKEKCVMSPLKELNISNNLNDVSKSLQEFSVLKKIFALRDRP